MKSPRAREGRDDRSGQGHPDDHDSRGRTSVTHAECLPLVIGPVDRRNGLSRENEQANTHNELAEYRPAPTRVKTPPRRRGPARGPFGAGAPAEPGRLERARPPAGGACPQGGALGAPRADRGIRASHPRAPGREAKGGGAPTHASQGAHPRQPKRPRAAADPPVRRVGAGAPAEPLRVTRGPAAAGGFAARPAARRDSDRGTGRRRLRRTPGCGPGSARGTGRVGVGRKRDPPAGPSCHSAGLRCAP
ncbi:hypothetical protein GCM10009574_062490 [Streptomyces asiaticus]